jgi:two-component system response regulator YesN
LYNLLVVDDEFYSVQAILQGVDWAEIGFSGVYGAQDTEEAMDIFRTHPIDVLVCDIEMPGSSGLELQGWVKEQYPNTETIFLTGHANFSYAQQAIQLGGFDYLLKPIKYEQLQKVVTKALEKRKQSLQLEEYSETYKKYCKLWAAQKPLLVERFWQDVFNRRMLTTPDNLTSTLHRYNLDFDLSMNIVLILISVERWHKELTQRDEEIMEYALRNAAEELILKDRPGVAVQDKNGLNFVLLYVPEGEPLAEETLRNRCKQYIEACVTNFYCSLSCYVGEPASIFRIPQTYHRLIELERENVSVTDAVIFQGKAHGKAGASYAKTPLFIDWNDWITLFELGKKEELLERVEEAFRTLNRQMVDAETVDAIYHSVLHMVYHLAHKREITVREFIGSHKRLEDTTATRSLSQLKAWAIRIITAGLDYINEYGNESSAIVDKIKRYVGNHLKEVTREDIAAHVYLNPAYISRLFKKETGQSLVDYIIQAKINVSKSLLTESNMKISQICESLGYDNFSHFGKTFKKYVGVTPQEYRKKYQKLN